MFGISYAHQFSPSLVILSHNGFHWMGFLFRYNDMYILSANPLKLIVGNKVKVMVLDGKSSNEHALIKVENDGIIGLDGTCMYKNVYLKWVSLDKQGPSDGHLISLHVTNRDLFLYTHDFRSRPLIEHESGRYLADEVDVSMIGSPVVNGDFLMVGIMIDVEVLDITIVKKKCAVVKILTTKDIGILINE